MRSIVVDVPVHGKKAYYPSVPTVFIRPVSIDEYVDDEVEEEEVNASKKILLPTNSKI